MHNLFYMDKDYIIREFKKSDILAATSIEQKAQKYSSPWDKVAFVNWVNNRSGISFALEVKGILVGYILLAVVKDAAEILNFAITLKFQRKGYGKLLLQCAISAVSEKSVKTIFLDVNSTNVKAIALYQSFGFQEIARRKQYYQNADAIVMQLLVA